MKACLTAIGCFSVILLFLSIYVVESANPRVVDKSACYSATWPFIVAVGLLLILAVVGILVSRTTPLMFCITALSYCLLPFLLYYTQIQPPLQDDNVGMGWLWIWLVTCIAWVVSLIMLITRIVILLRESRKTDHVRGVDVP